MEINRPLEFAASSPFLLTLNGPCMLHRYQLFIDNFIGLPGFFFFLVRKEKEREKNGFFAAPVAKFSQLKLLAGEKIVRRRMGRRKRSKKGSNSSIDEEEMSESSLQCVTDSIDCLKKLVTDGFAKIHEDMDKRR